MVHVGRAVQPDLGEQDKARYTVIKSHVDRALNDLQRLKGPVVQDTVGFEHFLANLSLVRVGEQYLAKLDVVTPISNKHRQFLREELCGIELAKVKHKARRLLLRCLMRLER